MPWKVAIVAPPRHLPITIADRLTGATSISRRKPNSRSQTIEAAENTAVNRTDMASTPGKMNVLKSTPAGKLRPASEDSPVPRTSRNSSGWISDVTARSRSRRNLISSRRHTMLTARRSERRLRSGTATRIWAARPLVRGRDPARLGGLGCHAHRLPRIRCAICRMWSVPDASASRMVVPV